MGDVVEQGRADEARSLAASFQASDADPGIQET
jgi:hypothetical protein